MLSIKEIKWVNSLKNRKYRLKQRAYIAEGPRLVNDLILNGHQPLKIIKTEGTDVVGDHGPGVVIDVTNSQLKQVSSLVQPNGLLAVFQMPHEERISEHPAGKWGIALDFIQDPGNLGTIIRTLAWLGIDYLYCSDDSVDVFNPKVVQASMGGIGSIKIHSVDLPVYLGTQEVPVYAAEMNGKPITELKLEPGIIVLGNEGRGLSEAVRKVCRESISIPKMGRGESLNVAVTTAILAAWVKLK